MPHGKANLKQLLRELGSRVSSRQELETLLARLAARGDLIETRAGHYVATRGNREFTVGRLSMHRDGYGFLIPDQPVEGVTGDVYIPADAARHAMHGDRVVVRIARIEAGGRADGEIVKILKRAHPTVVGEFQVRRSGFFVIPHDDRLHDWIEIPEDLAIPAPAERIDRIGPKPLAVHRAAKLDGMVVNVELLEYPQNGERAVGRVIEILGRPDDFGVDVEIVIRKHHLPHQFPPEVVEQAEAVPDVIAAGELAGRRDFRAPWISSPSTARRRAISTMPCGWTGCPTATTRCRCTSPT